MNVTYQKSDLVFNLEIYDLDDIEHAEEVSKNQKIQAFSDCLQEYGFIGIKVNGLKDLIDRTYEITKKYFMLDEDIKKLDKMSSEGPLGGYQKRFAEKVCNLDAKEKHHENKESFLFNGCSRQLPKADIDFQMIVEFHDQMSDLSNRILNVLHEYLGIENSARVPFNRHSTYSVTRLTWYPPMKVDETSKEIWCADHFDISPFALLPKATASGLQMQRDGIWYNVEAPNDTVIFNTGRIFESATASRIKPVYHRVIADEQSALTGRFSIVYFPSWDSDYLLRPWSSCIMEATKSMDEGEKTKFEKGLLSGKIEHLFRIYTAIIRMITLSDLEIKQLMESCPDNDAIKLLAIDRKENS